MRVKRTADCAAFTAVDASRLREVLHPRNDGGGLPFSLAVARVAPGQATERHALRGHEVYYLLSGSGRMHVGTDSALVAAGDAIHIPPGAVQWIENLGEEALEFVAVVAPPWCAEDEIGT